MITIFHGLFLRIRDLAKKSKSLRHLYYGFQRFICFFPKFSGLFRLFGFLKTFQFYKLDYISWKRNSLINRRISALVNQMACDQYIGGSAVNPGWLYHDYALPERKLIAHRKNTINRLLFLKKCLPLYKAIILDIGCSSGGISLGLASLGASKVIGIDYDKNAISIAKVIAKKYDIDNAEFFLSSLENFDIPEVDIVIWLSQWMWTVKKYGLEYGKDLLFDVSSRSKAEIMVFESAAACDGLAAIPDITQSDIENFLRLCTPYTLIENKGPFKDGWRLGGAERMVFICSKRQPIRWDGYQSIVTRTGRNTILKQYKPECIWAKDMEVRCLRRLEPFLYFSKLLDSGEDWIKMEWCGNKVTKRSQLSQLDEILKILSKTGIIHRDINLNNLLFKEGQLFLVDFGWAIVDGKEPPVKAPKGLGLGFYTYGEWDDASAAKKVFAMFDV